MKRQRGFSLLELIAAMLLLAIAFAALMKVAGGASVLTGNAATYDEAVLHARSLLDTAFVVEPIAPGVRSGRFDERYRWTLQVAPWEQANGAARLYRLDLTVVWGNPAHPRQARFSTLRLAGTVSGGAP